MTETIIVLTIVAVVAYLMIFTKDETYELYNKSLESRTNTPLVYIDLSKKTIQEKHQIKAIQYKRIKK